MKHCSNSCAASIPICNNNNRKRWTRSHEDFLNQICIVLSKLKISNIVFSNFNVGKFTWVIIIVKIIWMYILHKTNVLSITSDRLMAYIFCNTVFSFRDVRKQMKKSMWTILLYMNEIVEARHCYMKEIFCMRMV